MFKRFFERGIKTEKDSDIRNKNDMAIVEEDKLEHREAADLTRRTPKEEVLETREKISSKNLISGANRKSFVELEDDGAGIFKPKEGEVYILKGLETGTYYKRERAAYLVDRFLGFELTPSIVIRIIDGEEGSLQEFIPDAVTGSEMYRELSADKYKRDFTKMWLFDYIIWNSDRHSGNFLIKDGRVIAIDHGCTFVYGDDSRIFESHFLLEELFLPVPPDIAEKVEKLLAYEDGIKILGDLLKELLPEEEAKACVARIKKVGAMLKSGNIQPREELAFNPS